MAFAKLSFAMPLSTHGVTGADGGKKKYPLNTSALLPRTDFPGLDIRLHQRRVLKGGADINLTRLEYSALCCLAISPGRVFAKAQIFEAVWSMESESCQSSVANVICNLRKKIEPDSRKPTYIKTVIGVGYKFASGK